MPKPAGDGGADTTNGIIAAVMVPLVVMAMKMFTQAEPDREDVLVLFAAANKNKIKEVFETLPASIKVLFFTAIVVAVYYGYTRCCGAVDGYRRQRRDSLQYKHGERLHAIATDAGYSNVELMLHTEDALFQKVVDKYDDKPAYQEILQKAKKNHAPRLRHVTIPSKRSAARDRDAGRNEHDQTPSRSTNRQNKHLTPIAKNKHLTTIVEEKKPEEKSPA
jgi:predicted methyltransferase